MIHPTAIIDPGARLADDVDVGPYSVIGPDVEIGPGCVIGPHVVLQGPMRMGARNRVFQFASVGEECQDKKYAGEPTWLIIGDDNVIRECVTLQRGTVQDKGETRIGSRGLFMAYSHVAHDCVVGDDVILANSTQLAGHVQVADKAILGGGTLVHQFCQIGTHAMTGAGTVLFKDIPAFVMAQGNPAKPYAMNSEGLRRHQYPEASLRALKQAYRLVFRQGLTLEAAIARLQQDSDPSVQTFVESLRRSQRGILR
ncbi:acyl-ACP--UDP-N-acetylglucosamine O-acyltransferase [Natronospirillum operosum]|uniref:Acyl-[acyl-carrier-protein]--UDP-N-acetylglucosamine O-acyltransferase n=1 Tax=Natronospirillum operosum TaxID=2759953 RepID=A0A4Z0WHI0_9GAMM|nr:acyl-ACP--UDP-N-acetylglucosamine O-acyltransferase [Natronospirillum operosum]TGG95131.1 acyl-ACP--UDP-N-acetylglucosamine O-acyltransferase [Natronospirillum operosum]